MSENASNVTQCVVINQRQEIKVTGILSVDSFDEYRICASSLDGSSVIVEGEELCVKAVDLENCCFEATGDIKGFFYDEVVKAPKIGIIKRLFTVK